ncbi:MAG: DUF4190 domain-containing protein [Candidatus Saccharimonas sp.]
MDKSQIPTTQAPAAVPVAAEDPGKTLGIVSLVTSLLGVSLVGLITGIIGRKKSKAAGYKNNMALAGIILSIVGMVTAVTMIIVLMGAVSAGVGALNTKCKEHGPGVFTEGGTTYTCGVDGKNSATNGSSTISN